MARSTIVHIDFLLTHSLPEIYKQDAQDFDLSVSKKKQIT